MARHVYPAIGQCIYCDTTTPPLTDEHIIPLALGGNLILPKASCKICAKTINREIETPVLSQEWGALRAKLRFPTRKKKKRKTHLAVRRIDGRLRTVRISDHSTPVPLYKFREARILSGQERGDDNLHWTMDILADHEKEKEMQRRFPDWDKTHRIKAQPYPFARLIAKIGHAYTVAEYGLAAFTPLTRNIILGKSDDYFFIVGGSFDIEPAIPDGDHITDISIRIVNATRAQIRVDIRLFSQITTPSYHVVVGDIDLNHAAHVRAFEQYRLDGKIKIIPFKNR